MIDIFYEIKNTVTIERVLNDFGYEVYKNKCLCPFHNETRPSLSIKEDENYFKCFGCLVAGDVITLVKKIKGLSNNYQAAIYLNEKYNLNLPVKTKKEFNIGY